MVAIPIIHTVIISTLAPEAIAKMTEDNDTPSGRKRKPTPKVAKRGEGTHCRADLRENSVKYQRGGDAIEKKSQTSRPYGPGEAAPALCGARLREHALPGP